MKTQNPLRVCASGHRSPESPIRPVAETTCARCDLLELVALAYGDCQEPPRGARLLWFRTEVVRDWDLLATLLVAPGKYNHFDGAGRVAAELEPLFPYLAGVEFGREYSPVLYAHVPYWSHQAANWHGEGMGSPVPEETRRGLAESFLEAMRRAGADEADDLGHALRAWWD